MTREKNDCGSIDVADLTILAQWLVGNYPRTGVAESSVGGQNAVSPYRSWLNDAKKRMQ